MGESKVLRGDRSPRNREGTRGTLSTTLFVVPVLVSPNAGRDVGPGDVSAPRSPLGGVVGTGDTGDRHLPRVRDGW